MTQDPTVKGTCRPLFVFEVGQSIDLDRCEPRIGTTGERLRLQHRGRVPHLFQYRPAPLRIVQEAGPPSIVRYPTQPGLDLTLYDFGAISVGYVVPFETTLAELRQISIALRAEQAFVADARGRVIELIEELGPAVLKPRVADLVEDYLIVQLEGAVPGATAAGFVESHATAIAQILRADPGPLSDQEVRDATEAHISFGVTDVTIVDWDAALVLDPDPEDVRAVLEMANVQLLEMRYLDGQLDQALERAYDLLARRRGWRALLPPSASADLRGVAELQLESAVLLERVTNALKFFGEEYLTRIYRLVARRFHLADWDASISRKLATIESLYQKTADQVATRRLELLEWVVILLIALEVVLSLGRR